MNKMLLFILTLLFIFSCNKEKKYPERLVHGFWGKVGSTGFKSNSVGFVEKYLENGKWYFAIDFEKIENDCSLVGSYSPSNQFYHSDTLNYWINGNILIRERHEFHYDLNSKIVLDSLEIKQLKKGSKPKAEKTYMILIPLNYYASEYYKYDKGADKFNYIGHEKEYKKQCP